MVAAAGIAFTILAPHQALRYRALGDEKWTQGNGGIDPTQWNGYAWGFGIERMAMLKHDVDDIRLFYESDLRFLEQF